MIYPKPYSVYLRGTVARGSLADASSSINGFRVLLPFFLVDAYHVATALYFPSCEAVLL